jgi:hypothetical protein
MTPQIMIQMLLRKSITLGSGLLIGMWIAMQYPDLVKQIFQSPLAGLMGVLISFWMSYKNETAPIDPPKPPQA